MSRETECLSMYSDMSTRIMACSSSNRNSASARASSVLPTPVGTKKYERANGPIGILQAGARTANRVSDRHYCFGLSDDTLGNPVFHLKQFVHVAFKHFGYGNARPFGDDFRDIFRTRLPLSGVHHPSGVRPIPRSWL